MRKFSNLYKKGANRVIYQTRLAPLLYRWHSTKHLHLQPVLDDCFSLGCQYTLGMELDAMNVVVLVA